MAFRSANFVNLDGDTVIRSTNVLHSNKLFENTFDRNKSPSSEPNKELYLQEVDPNVPIHDSRKKNHTSKIWIYNNAETQQQNSNPSKTELVSRRPDVLNESNLLKHDRTTSPFAVNSFRTETSMATRVLGAVKRPVAATRNGEQSSTNPVNQFLIDSLSADVLPTLKTTPVPRTAKRPASTTSDGEPSRKRVKTRISLPLTLNANSGAATVLACPDTGSEENIISLDLAQSLGYNIFTSPSQNRTFALANGSIVEAVGEIVAECSFGIETTPAAVPMTLVFYVFMKLASPIIMGLAFLEQTKTLSKHRDRLLRVPRSAHQPIQVYSVGRPRNQMYCYLDWSYEAATPDSGSEVNLMTRSYASLRGLHIENAKEVVEFADGTIAVTSGVVRAKLTIRDDHYINHNIIHNITPTADFYLMDNLRQDLLIGEESLEELKVFTRGQNTLFPSPYTVGPAGLNRIRHLGAVDHVLSWVKKKISLTRRPHGGSISTQVSLNDSLDDQRENDRREREEIRIVNLPVDQREGAIAAEALKQAQYDNTAGGP